MITNISTNKFEDRYKYIRNLKKVILKAIPRTLKSYQCTARYAKQTYYYYHQRAHTINKNKFTRPAA